MQVGYQVGQVVLRGSVDLQQQWRQHLEQFRAARDAGFDIYGWAHHYLIDPFQHFQPLPVLARLAAEPGQMQLATSVLLLPLLNPVDVAEQVATLDHLCEGRAHSRRGPGVPSGRVRGVWHPDVAAGRAQHRGP